MNDQTDDAEIEKAGDESTPEENATQPEKGPEWEQELDTYPLRDKGDDPRWAVRTVWIWTGIALTALAFILTMLVLGAVYD